MTSKSKQTSDEVISKYTDFSDFIRNATVEDKEIVFTGVMGKVSKQQLNIIQKAKSLSENL